MRTKLRQLNPYTTHYILGITAATAVGLAATAAGGIASAAMQGEAAGDASDIQSRFSQMGIDEIRNALGPALKELGIATDITDNELRQLLGQGLGELDPYSRAGKRGLRQLNFATGADRGLGPKPKAIPRPSLPKYASRGPNMKTADGARPDEIKPQRGQFANQANFEKALGEWKTYRDDFRAFEGNQQELARYTARENDPSFGELTRPYEDKYGQQIIDTAGEKYTDKYGQQILDVSGEKYVDKYGQEIIDTAKDTFDLADFEKEPGYEFRRGEGNRGIEQSAAAGGNLQSGAALKELNRFNQDYASNEFGKAEGRWRNVRDTTLNALTGQQGFDYGSFRDNKSSRLGALEGQQGFDYGSWSDNKGSRLNALGGQQNFDYGTFTGDRDFKYGTLRDQVGIGERATSERNNLRQYFGGSLADNRNRGATQAGQWRMNSANSIAELLGGQGNSQAAGRIGEANAYGDAIGSGSNALLYALLYGGGGGKTRNSNFGDVEGGNSSTARGGGSWSGFGGNF